MSLDIGSAQGEVAALFSAEGFRCNWVRTEARTVVNRASGVSMDRLWVQACFTFSPVTPLPPQLLPPPATAAAPSCWHSLTSAAASRVLLPLAEAAPAAAALQPEPPGVTAQQHGDDGSLEWDDDGAGGVVGSDVVSLFLEPVEMQVALPLSLLRGLHNASL